MPTVRQECGSRQGLDAPRPPCPIRALRSGQQRSCTAPRDLADLTQSGRTCKPGASISMRRMAGKWIARTSTVDLVPPSPRRPHVQSRGSLGEPSGERARAPNSGARPSVTWSASARRRGSSPSAAASPRPHQDDGTGSGQGHGPTHRRGRLPYHPHRWRLLICRGRAALCRKHVTAVADSMMNTTASAKGMWTCPYPLCKW